MKEPKRFSDRLNLVQWRAFLWKRLIVLIGMLFVTAVSCEAQCPNSGQTKIFQSKEGSGYYFYRFLGDGRFAYFLSGKKFSFNDKDDPGKTFLFIDDLTYEPLLVQQAELAKYIKSSKPEDMLLAQAKHQQEYFKKNVPSIVITDYGISPRTNASGEKRLFYLWRKDSAAGSTSAPQYLVSTVIQDGVFVMSVMPTKGMVSDDDLFLQVENYVSRFQVVTAAMCAKVLAQ